MKLRLDGKILEQEIVICVEGYSFFVLDNQLYIFLSARDGSKVYRRTDDFMRIVEVGTIRQGVIELSNTESPNCLGGFWSCPIIKMLFCRRNEACGAIERVHMGHPTSFDKRGNFDYVDA